MFNLLKKKSTKITEEEKIQIKKEKTAQEWMPIADIKDRIVYKRNNEMLGIVRIQPENLSLFSINEKKRKIEAFREVLNSMRQDIQIFCIGRPVDLTNYIEWLKDKHLKESNFIKKQLLKSFMNQAIEMSSNGSTVERRFYMIIKNQDTNNLQEFVNKLEDFNFKLNNDAELKAHICNEDEALDLYCLFTNPISSNEKNEIEIDFPTILE